MVSFRQASKNKQDLKYFSIPRFDELTYLIGGVRENELITISARVGCGKTTLALNLFTELAKKHKCGYISYEMNTKELIDKIYRFCDSPNIDNMGFDDDCGIFDTKLMEKYIKQYDFKFIFIDYLQLMGGNIKKNTRALKEICRKYNVVIFMLAQLNRKAENVEPQLSMLKDSGTIEQDSDEVGFIKEHSIKVAKNRKGEIGEIDIEFDKPYALFSENSEYKQTKKEIIDKFEKMCMDFLDDNRTKKKGIDLHITNIKTFLNGNVKEFDENLYNQLYDKYIELIDFKTQLIKEKTPKNLMVGIENIKLL